MSAAVTSWPHRIGANVRFAYKVVRDCWFALEVASGLRCMNCGRLSCHGSRRCHWDTDWSIR